mmetsp:Transcript_161350/g.309939  ORF Transcript_161350/g.309939 Transcript_161350/m.309939 type:complete len:389 (+) Transcript_161350:112-1278(+)
MCQASPIFVDCHCHLTSGAFDADLDAVLARAERAGVCAMMACSASQADILQVIQLRQIYPERIHPCLGLHPLGGYFDDALWEETQHLIANEHVERGITGIGEIGLDFSRPLLREKAREKGTTEAEVRETQLKCFRAHLELAKKLDVPVNVHSRNAERETLEILIQSQVHGVLHAYKGDVSLAVEAARTGRLYFSFPPSIVYKKEYQEAAQALPPHVLLLETDSPSLGATGPKERNEPAKIVLAAAKLAELKCMAVEKVAAITTRNAVRLFGPTTPALVALALEASDGPEKRPPRWRKGDPAGNPVDAATANLRNRAKAPLGHTATAYRQPAAEEACPPAPPLVAEKIQDPIGDMVADRRRRWGRAQMQKDIMDPTLCSSSYGSIGRCD